MARTWGAWDENAQAAMFARDFDPAGRRVVVVEGRDVGVISVQRGAEALFLANIQILPAFQGRGLGTALITDLLAEAARDGVPVTLQVLKVNPARRLYRRLGFAPVGETSTHIQMRAQAQLMHDHT